jgi:hypothetical protein
MILLLVLGYGFIVALIAGWIVTMVRSYHDFKVDFHSQPRQAFAIHHPKHFR